MNHIGILVVSPHAVTREGIRALAAKTEDIEVVGEAESVVSLPELTELRPDVALVEIAAPQTGILRELAYVLSSMEKMRTVILSAIGDANFVRSALGLGVLGYVLMDSDTERLLLSIRSVAQNHRFVDPMLGNINPAMEKRA